MTKDQCFLMNHISIFISLGKSVIKTKIIRSDMYTQTDQFIKIIISLFYGEYPMIRLKRKRSPVLRYGH